MYKLTSILSIIVILTSLLDVSVGQIVETGQCNPNIQLVNNFDIQRFAGNWYEIQRTASSEQNKECSAFSFTSGTVINVVHSGVNDNFQEDSTGTATLTTGTAQLTLNIPMFSNPINFWVLLTDYEDYAVTYSCENISATERRIYLWVLGRLNTYSSQVVQNFVTSSVYNLLGIDLNSLQTVDHSATACYTLPVIAPGQSIVIPGQCDVNIPVQQNFNVAGFTGTWHQIASYYTESSAGSCVKAQYTAGNDVVNVLNSQVINQALLTITGTATVISTDNSARLRVVLNVTSTQTVTQDLWVLATDYTSYAISYSCENVTGTQKRIYSWILSRDRQLSAAAQTAVGQVIGSILELNNRYYLTTDQSADGCFYFPEVTGQPVTFPGQCNMNIPAMANFDPVRYTGLWYDIESYPAPFQTGTCSKAQYTLNNDGSVRVENTQVVNQLLETWIGSAVVASTDGSAKLTVTFNVNGIDVTSSYWVLNTDYTSYALVYSCTDIDEDTTLVFSWKLSRTPTLTTAADTAINSIMNTIPVLDQRYYITRGHTDADCLYYPDNNGGDVLLPGQCVADSEVPAVTNFNPNTFAGTWHEVARFPSGLQQGECAATQYNAVSGFNAYTVTHTSVNNERQKSTIAQATISNDRRGVLTATIDGVPFDNVYILATDYTEYALLYSCRNVDTERKQIYSWKLSRTKSGLSVAANTTINQLVNANNDLWEGYYRETSQDNAACFHYPVYEQVPPYIELTGPCPDTIRGVANFNANAYLGRWYETARYPMIHQAGQCSRAEYSLEERVVVYNTEVADQTLRTQAGFADVASTDGSGVLNVEFNISGVIQTSNYYILATDYTSYSLVYSCANTDDGNRRVSSWKLSRTPTLSAQASAAMLPIITNTEGLAEEYYQATSQSDDACFYIPDVEDNQASLFRGQCETITGIQGFDVEKYLGWWHEIQSYPVDGTRGDCRSSQYTLDGNTYRVVDTQIQSNAATSISGTVTVTNDGRLRRTMTDGTVQDIWVLATDYESYALLYSCENVNTEYRRVWSAKHSKSRTLTTEAQNAMAPIITSNRVLYEQFYLNVDQSNATCFYYPTITQGQIIIPGQCDSEIPVVQNFIAADFAGSWFHTERYDDVGSSSCVGSRYTLNEGARNTGAITVLNFEVRNGELQTVEGSAIITATNGEATIEITLPIADSEDTTTTSISILTTDYLSYALAYNCVNVNAFQRQVRAWKLSRNRTLPSEGTVAINDLIQQRLELYQPYFKEIEQNDECAEPSSALIVKSSIIVLLVCAILQRLL